MAVSWVVERPARKVSVNENTFMEAYRNRLAEIGSENIAISNTAVDFRLTRKEAEEIVNRKS